MGKAPNSSAAERRRRKEPEGAPPVRTQPQKLPQFHGKLGKKDFPALLASLTKPFPCLLPEYSQLSQSAPVLPLWSSFGHSKCCLQPGLETILGFGQGSGAGAPWARLGRNLAEHQEFGPRRSRQGSTRAPDKSSVQNFLGSSAPGLGICWEGLGRAAQPCEGAAPSGRKEVPARSFQLSQSRCGEVWMFHSCFSLSPKALLSVANVPGG